MTEREANDEMVEGYRDGFELVNNLPEIIAALKEHGQ